MAAFTCTEGEPPPHEFDITSAPRFIASEKLLKIHESVVANEPFVTIPNLIGIILESYATPMVPRLLLTPAIIPAQFVPWPLVDSGAPLLLLPVASYPGNKF